MSAALSADRLAELDLATLEKRPLLRELLSDAAGPSLDLGPGLGYYTRHLLAPIAPPVVAADVAYGNLQLVGPAHGRCGADAAKLPFAQGAFRTVLLTDVLEHCPDDRGVLVEVARVLRPGGLLVLTVPSLEWGFADLLGGLVGSVHDEEGPERHYREGYRREELRRRLAEAGFAVEEERDLLRPASKLLIELIALVHLAAERWGRRRRAWTWSDVLTTPPPGLGVYRRLFPLVRGLHSVLRRLPPRRGFELAVRARRRPPPSPGATGRGTGNG